MAEQGSGKGKGVALNPDLDIAPATPPTPPRRRSRSFTFVGANPIDVPLNSDDFELAALREKILTLEASEAKNESANPSEPARPGRSTSFVAVNPLDTPITSTDHQLATFCKQLEREEEREDLVEQFRSRSPIPNSSTLHIVAEEGTVGGVTFYRRISNEVTDVFSDTDWEKSIQNTNQWFVKDKSKGHKLQKTPVPADFTMNNYQNYMDPAGSAPGASPRQAPPSPSQNVAHANGMNGGMGMGGMVGFPTPAGHQSDLNYIMNMVEDLSSQLRHNQQLTANIVEKVGKVREKAATMNLTNDELVAVVAAELNGKS